MATKMIDIRDMIENQIERYRSILGLPRRKDYSFIQDTEQLLNIVKDKRNLNKIEQVICSEFNLKKNTFNYVLPTLERANLVMKTNKQELKLTVASENYLKEKNVCYLAKGFIENYFGLLEVLLILSENFSLSRVEVFNKWVILYENEFKKRALTTHRSQFNITLRFLIGYGLLKKEGTSFIVNYKLLHEIEEICLF